MTDDIETRHPPMHDNMAEVLRSLGRLEGFFASFKQAIAAMKRTHADHRLLVEKQMDEVKSRLDDHDKRLDGHDQSHWTARGWVLGASAVGGLIGTSGAGALYKFIMAAH